MSILIKGMKKAENCWSCPFVDGEYGTCDVDGFGHDPDRAALCPVKEVPDGQIQFTDSELILLLTSITCGEEWYTDFPDIVDGLRELKKKLYEVWCAEASKPSAEKESAE